MYSEQDLINAKKQVLYVWIIYGVLFAAVLTVLALGLVYRWAVAYYITGVLFTLLSVFYWGMFGGKVLRWYKFVKEMHGGLEHELQGTVAEIDATPAVREGLEFLRLRLLTGDKETDDAGGRVLYYDAAKLPLPVGENQRIQVRVYGIYIKDIKGLEAER